MDEWPTPGPILESCDGCGACCLEQGAPPDYVALRLNPHFADDPSFADDAARLAALPDDARRLLDDYLAQCSRHTPCAVSDSDDPITRKPPASNNHTPCAVSDSGDPITRKPPASNNHTPYAVSDSDDPLTRKTSLTPTSPPCVWYDPATFRCRYYEHRPSTCRVFERGSPGCHIYRQRHGIGDSPVDERTVRD